MIKDLLQQAQEEVITPLQTKGKFVSKKKLKQKRRYFSEELRKIWKNKDIIEQDKFEDGDIFQYPLAVVYFLYCLPVQLVAVIKDVKKLHEYWDFYLEEYPEIKFDGDIQRFYNGVKNSKTDW